MTSGRSLQPAHPGTVFEPSDLATWDQDGAIAGSTAYRHALWFETGGIPQGEPEPGFALLQDGGMPAPARRGALGRRPRALLLAAAGVAGLASGMVVSGSGSLPDWRPLLDRAWVTAAGLVPGAAESTSPAGTTLTSTAQAATIAVAPRATPGAYGPPRRLAAAGAALPTAPAASRRRPAADGFHSELVPGVVLAATLDGIPGWQDAALPAAAAPAPSAPPAPAVVGGAPAVVEAVPVVEPLAPAYRVQLATLRYRRNAVPVWERFVRRFGPLGERLERYVTTAETVHGQRFLVQVGPFADAPHAAALCDRILQKGGDCVVVPPPSS